MEEEALYLTIGQRDGFVEDFLESTYLYSRNNFFRKSCL